MSLSYHVVSVFRMNTDQKLIKWERRRKTGYAPSLRSGCTMALWTAKNTGILFGGVFDEDRGEEGMDSVFFNDLWVSYPLFAPQG